MFALIDLSSIFSLFGRPCKEGLVDDDDVWNDSVL